MGANPKPQQVVASFDSQRSILQTNSDGTVFSNFLEMQRLVCRVCLQKFVVFISKITN